MSVLLFIIVNKCQQKKEKSARPQNSIALGSFKSSPNLHYFWLIMSLSVPLTSSKEYLYKTTSKFSFMSNICCDQVCLLCKIETEFKNFNYSVEACSWVYFTDEEVRKI